MNALIDKILKNSPTKMTAVLSESVLFTDKDVIPTPLPILNVAFSGKLDGGMLSGLTILAGQSKSFKTLLGLFCVKAYLDKYPDAVCILYDSEGGVTPDYLDNNGIDPSRVIHVPIEHIEMLKFDMAKTLKTLERADKVIMLVDSIGNTASLKELEDAENEKSVAEMQRAKSLKALFRIITPSLIAKDVPCICIAHTYKTMEMYSKDVISGGCLEAGTEIQLADGSPIKIETVEPGMIVNTLSGPKPVTHVWNPETLADGEPECYEVTFDDGHVVVCSDEHRFMKDGEWTRVSDLIVGDDVGDTKINNIVPVGVRPVYDITVADVNHYLLKNGVASHNTGIIYSATQAFIISKAQDKVKDELAGWKFTINVEKSRHVREKSKLPFIVHYEGGILKWSGMLDIALAAGAVIKPKVGWYQRVDLDTGEVLDGSFRERQTLTDDSFWEPIVASKKFHEYVERRYSLSSDMKLNDSDEVDDVMSSIEEDQ